MSAVVFFLAAIGAIAGAIGVISLENPFYSVLALVCHLLSLAALFLLLDAQFIAAAQVVVYAGAVMVLYVFVVAYVGGQDQPVGGRGSTLGPLAVVTGLALLVELLIAVLGSGLEAIDSRGAPYDASFGSTAQIGKLLLTQFLFTFEVASFLLLIAAVGAVMLARRRRGLDPERPFAPLDEVRPMGSGTMAEATGRLSADFRRGAAARKATGKDRGGW